MEVDKFSLLYIYIKECVYLLYIYIYPIPSNVGGKVGGINGSWQNKSYYYTGVILI
jgi:hypothetical protein